jgi:hypothetical protein
MPEEGQPFRQDKEGNENDTEHRDRCEDKEACLDYTLKKFSIHTRKAPDYRKYR